MYIVKQGEVELVKKITVTDILDNPITKLVCLLSATEGEVIGEDSFRFAGRDEEDRLVVGARPSFYSAKAAGKEGCVVYEANAESFLRGLPNIVNEFKQKCELR